MQATELAPELCLIFSYTQGKAFDPDYLKECEKVLELEGLSFELILVFGQAAMEAWVDSEAFSQHRSDCLSLLVKHSNGLHALQLAGLMRANGRICVTMNPYLEYDPYSILTLLFVADKSNCGLVYGSRKRKYNSDMLLHRLLYVPLSLLAGLPPYTTSYRLVKKEEIQSLKVKTPYYFHLDQQLNHRVENHSYLDFPSRNDRSFSDGYLYGLKHLLVAGILLETLCALTVIADIYLLVQGKLLWAFGLSLLAFGLVFSLYMLKWRRRIAFKLLEKRP